MMPSALVVSRLRVKVSEVAVALGAPAGCEVRAEAVLPAARRPVRLWSRSELGVRRLIVCAPGREEGLGGDLERRAHSAYLMLKAIFAAAVGDGFIRRSQAQPTGQRVRRLADMILETLRPPRTQTLHPELPRPICQTVRARYVPWLSNFPTNYAN